MRPEQLEQMYSEYMNLVDNRMSYPVVRTKPVVRYVHRVLSSKTTQNGKTQYWVFDLFYKRYVSKCFTRNEAKMLSYKLNRTYNKELHA